MGQQMAQSDTQQVSVLNQSRVGLKKTTKKKLSLHMLPVKDGALTPKSAWPVFTRTQSSNGGEGQKVKITR